MKIPKSPPSFSDMMKKLSGKKMSDILAYVTLHNGRDYYHWDELRYRPLPANTQLSKENVWFGIKMLRNASAKLLPFKDCKGEAFRLNRTDQVLSDLRQIDLRAGGTIETGGGESNPALARERIKTSLIEEPFNSSVLEGAATTRERAKEMIEANVAPITRDDKMVFNNYQAMEFVKDNLSEPLTPELILETHRIITEGTLDRPEMAGKLRDNDLVDVVDNYGQVLHSPPHYEELVERLKVICSFANETEKDSQYFIHPIVRAIILHFQLAYDHPFVDGNGRTARALFYWSVLRSGYWMFEYISISKVIKMAPSKYGKAFLYCETDDNDTTYFILHQLGVLLRSIVDLESYIEEKNREFAAFSDLLKGHYFNHRQEFLLNQFVRQKMTDITIKEHENMQKVSQLTARKDLEKLVSTKLLRKEIKNNRAYYSLHKKAIERLNIKA